MRTALVPALLLAVCPIAKPDEAGDEKKIAELRTQIANKKAELSRLEQDLAKLTSGKSVGVGEWSRIGDARVKITKVSVQKVQYKAGLFNDSKFTSDEPLIMIWINIENLSKTKKMDYFRRSGFSGIKLIDEHDNSYGQRLDDEDIDGATQYKSLYPGDEAITDVMIFERPVDAAKQLQFSYPSLFIGDKGNHEFRIPATAWKKK